MKKMSLAFLGIAYIFAVLGTTVVISGKAEAATPPDNCFAFNAGTGTISNYYNNQANNPANPACPRDVDIPAQIGGVNVVTIYSALPNGAFTSKGITSVTFPNTLTTIGDNAFYDNQLTSVVIPNSVTTIAYGAFWDNNLSSVTLPAGLTSIEDYAFADNQLTSITMPTSLQTIKEGAFMGNQITNITLPSSLTSIGDIAFLENRLTQLVVPNNVTAIGEAAFDSNLLTSVQLSNSLTSLSADVFSNNKLDSVMIPNSVTMIDRSSFSLQSSLATFQDDFYSSNMQTKQNAINSIHYVRLYTANPANPNNLLDGIKFWATNLDGNAANGWETYNQGGHLINPASVAIQYLDQANSQLQQTRIITGQLGSGDYTDTYLVIDGVDVPNPASPYSMTTQELSSARALLSSTYWRIGQSKTVSAPVIAGYDSPNPAAQTFVLGASTNSFNFVYASTVPNAGTTTLSNTGYNSMMYLGLGLTILIGGALILPRRAAPVRFNK